MLTMIKKKFSTVLILQSMLLSVVWLIAIGMTLLFINLDHVSYQVNDNQTASVAISLVAILVFWILAGISTYVLVGLYRGGRKENQT
jgi:uncharacterized membrane protein